MGRAPPLDRPVSCTNSQRLIAQPARLWGSMGQPFDLSPGHRAGRPLDDRTCCRANQAEALEQPRFASLEPGVDERRPDRGMWFERRILLRLRRRCYSNCSSPPSRYRFKCIRMMRSRTRSGLPTARPKPGTSSPSSPVPPFGCSTMDESANCTPKTPSRWQRRALRKFNRLSND